MAKGWKLPFDRQLHHFSQRIAFSTGCWEWQGYKDKMGYGKYKWADRKNWRAHRLMFKLAFGEFDETLDVCHTCDNPSCVNPYHLFLGTHSDNMRDMYSKGRWPILQVSGTNHFRAKLDDDKVRNIRKLAREGWTQAKLGSLYGVPHTAIGCVLRGKTWKHVT